ncbi:MAG: nitrilase-related carbon-nitrogen hydrolase [Crocinitomicaceae bacterium]|nr:nitrilase-related carbon-nitrogen hydrolase [Crocinitomicaceae bacterium]
MQNLRVTLVQANQVWEDKQANFTNYTQLLETVETDLIVFPEMFHTGFSMHVDDMSEDFLSSEGIHWLKETAALKDAAVYTSLIIRDGDKTYNRGVFITPEGQLSVYDKQKSFGLAKEDQYYTAGTNGIIVQYKGWSIKPLICYDLRFPEIARNEILPNQFPAYDVLVYVANWPEKRSHHWNALLAARAIENQCYVVGVNRVGVDANNLVYRGDSKVIDALGNEILFLRNQESATTIVMNKNELNEIQKELPFLKDR